MKRFVLLAAVLLAACGAPRDDSFFPLAKGHRWATTSPPSGRTTSSSTSRA
jgi:hypothetical protein